MANRVAKVLNIGIDSAYRRIGGKYAITFEESITLCKYFGISLDLLLNETNRRQYALVPADLKFEGIASNLAFAQELLEYTEIIRMTPKGEIIMSAADIPVFHFIAYKELTFFQIYSWYKNVYDFPGKFEDFLKELPVDEIFKLLEKIHHNYTLIPSSEIWTERTIDSTLKLLRYHHEMRHFSDPKIPQLIGEQLFSAMDKLEDWIKRGSKDAENAPFKFYVNEIDIGNTFIFTKKEGKQSCILRLFTINGLHIKDPYFCEEVEHWLKSIINRSTLISEISTKERFFFLSAQKKKITDFTGTL